MANNRKSVSDHLTMMEKLEAIHTYGVDLDNATIFMAGEIDANFTVALRMKVAMLEGYFQEELKKQVTELNLVCNSVGGDATIILSILDYYEELKKRGIIVNVHFEGNCMSAATFVCCGATGKRTAGPRCRFMIHEIQVAPPEASYTQAKSFAQETSFLQSEMYKLYAELTQARKRKKSPIEKEVKMWKDICAKETYMSAERAKDLGLIDNIA